MSATTPIPHPAGVLMNLIITLLTPMFLAAAEGNLTFARQAALETLNAYRAETGSDLITVAKIIGFGLAALAALSLSMADDLPIPAMLRLHASANASDRAEHRNRQALAAELVGRDTSSREPPWERKPGTPTPPDPAIDEAALAAAAADMQSRTAAHLAQFTTPAPQPAASLTEAERRYQATWAASAAAIAAETAASLPTLPPQERESAALWINVLNETAKEFMAGNALPRPRPGDLAAMTPPAGS
jgi:hypothetical protein